jgi:plastocyanin
MLTGLTCRHHAVFLTGLYAGLFITACAKGADRPRAESAASAENAAPVDSAASPTDTTAVPTKSAATPPASAAAVAKPARPDTPPPKPAIDPGKKNPKPVSPRSGMKPRADSSPVPAAATSAPGSDQGVKYDGASNTVTFELVAGPFNFNGFTNGAATLTVPSKANLVVNFVNKDGTPHSAEVISGDGPIPNAAGDPAIPRAYTNKALEGLPQEATDVMRFSVPESGSYRFFCGVPGHGLSGMWIWLKVDPAAKAPSFGPTRG